MKAAVLRGREDVAIVDVRMPELDGLTLCSTLLQPDRKSIDVIVVSGSAELETQERCEGLGATYAFKGPELWNTVKAAIDRIFPGIDVDHGLRHAPDAAMIVVTPGQQAPLGSTLSLARRLRQSGASVLVIEKSEPAREATHAAAGMIAHCDPGNPPAMAGMIAASARMYPQFVADLRAEAFESPDLRRDGTIAFFGDDEAPACDGARPLHDDMELARLEPLIALRGRAYLLPECSVDPRKLAGAQNPAHLTVT